MYAIADFVLCSVVWFSPWADADQAFAGMGITEFFVSTLAYLTASR